MRGARDASSSVLNSVRGGAEQRTRLSAGRRSSSVYTVSSTSSRGEKERRKEPTDRLTRRGGPEAWRWRSEGQTAEASARVFNRWNIAADERQRKSVLCQRMKTYNAELDSHTSGFSDRYGDRGRGV